jgi:hypothetical protein
MSLNFADGCQSIDRPGQLTQLSSAETTAIHVVLTLNRHFGFQEV